MYGIFSELFTPMAKQTQQIEIGCNDTIDIFSSYFQHNCTHKKSYTYVLQTRNIYYSRRHTTCIYASGSQPVRGGTGNPYKKSEILYAYKREIPLKSDLPLVLLKEAYIHTTCIRQAGRQAGSQLV